MSASAPVEDRRPRVLLVEDEAVIGLDLAERLRDFGYDIVGVAASGERARQMAAERKPDVVLMDIVIKGPRDGIETAALIRSEFDVPVVFLSAFADADTVNRAREVAPYGYLIKPFRPDELRTTIEMARQRHRMEERVADSERWLSATLQCLGDAVVATDEQGQVRFMNPVAEQLLGRRLSEVQGLPLHDFLELQDAEGIDHLPDPTARALASGQPTALETGTLVQQADADAVPVELRASPIRDDRQRLLGAVLVMRNITERRRAEAALARMAQLDALTGLPNRAALLPQIAAMASNARRVGKSLAVLFVDLDGFKDVNDSYGHRIGDELLVQVARRLRSGLRAEDYVARLGGDEFVVLAGNLPEPAMARAIGRKLIGILGRPYRIDEHAISITASIGISLPAAEAIEATELLRQADLAMYWAKGRGKNRFATFAEGHGAAGSPAGGPAPSIRDAD